ncbi:MAG: porphobilinogen synthase [Cyclobacteriaceae bacterium]|nr:porphobilinogen synthase [Cyclobacteriaceae bacterium]
MEKEKYYSNQRRVRSSQHIRELAASVTLSHRDFIQPLFVDESIAAPKPIGSLTEIYSDTIESVIQQIERDLLKGVSKFLLFPVMVNKKEKDFDFSFVLAVVTKIKSKFSSSIWLAVDVCLCTHASHGHCGILDSEKKKVLNNETVEVLANYALQLAHANADCIAPSDMMDGRIRAIRVKLDQHGFDEVAIMSYSAKFSSNFYGPFRDACHSTPNASGLRDRKTYQISSYNPSDAIQSSLRDWEEGADLLMVKPALVNLDILSALRQRVHAPLAAYHVSGEYESIELLARQGLIDRAKAHVEVWVSLKRAGADGVISYASRHAQEWISQIEY